MSDLSDRPVAERVQAALQIAGDEASKPFSLSTGPLLRFRLIRLGLDDHILVLSIHHIISDGWSLHLLLEEIGEMYSGFVAGSEPRLHVLAHRYSDFCRWQRSSITADFLADEIKYWKNKLQDAATILQLPTDHRRPAVHAGRGNNFQFELSQETTKGLTALVQREGATLFMGLVAAFQVLLSRYTSQENILIGTPAAGRNDVDLENLIGFFVNTLVLRADLTPEMSFRQLLWQARANTLEALAHQNMPFEKLVEILGPDRSSNQNPVFQVMFILQNTPKQKVVLPGLVIEEIDFDSGVAKFDLTLEIVELDTLHCTLEYDSELFEAATIAQMAAHFTTLVVGAVAAPDEKISKLPLLTSAEVKQLAQWNNTAREYPRQLCIHTAFEEQAACTPDKTALIDRERSLSYSQLNTLANRLAQELIRKGIGPATLVAVSLSRSIEMVIALIGILKTGAAYVPLDPTYPKQRLTFMVRDSRARLVITSEDVELWRQEPVDVITLDVDSLCAESREVCNLSLPLTPDCRMYVIYTSGSTGQPKGVEATHRSSMNRFAWMWDAYPFAEGEICCQKTSLGFVDSIWEIFGPLLQGVPSVIIPDEAVIDPKELVHVLSQYGVTRIVLVPSLLRVILEGVDDLKNRLPKLRLWSCSGEALSPDLVRRFSTMLPSATLLNIYGSSEIAADVTWHEITPLDGNGPVPIGKPISNVQTWILDRALNPVPVGVQGELYVGGDCLALGYLGRPELTTERFITHQFELSRSGRLFRTGDLAVYLPNGEIEYRGRTDSQVKIRGIRVELGEIEAVLASHSTVNHAMVVLADHFGQPRLAAYLTFHSGQYADANELRLFLRSSLPEYMIPTAYFVADALPHLPSGKVDRKSLIAQSTARRVDARIYVAPQSLTQERIVLMWRELLRLEKVSVEDNFFELGGNSLMAMQVTARIRKVFEVEVPVRSVFDYPTIKGLAHEVDTAIARGVKVSLAPISSFSQGERTDDELRKQIEKMSREELQELLQVLREKSGGEQASESRPLAKRPDQN